MRRYSNNIKLESLKDKSTLVKLLAEEDVTVSYQSVPTASFNLEQEKLLYQYGKTNQKMLWI